MVSSIQPRLSLHHVIICVPSHKRKTKDGLAQPEVAILRVDEVREAIVGHVGTCLLHFIVKKIYYNSLSDFTDRPKCILITCRFWGK